MDTVIGTGESGNNQEKVMLITFGMQLFVNSIYYFISIVDGMLFDILNEDEWYWCGCFAYILGCGV